VAPADEKYKFPPLSLLREPVAVDATASEEEHRQNAENLLRILGEFNVEVTIGEIHVGPVITRYEWFRPPEWRVEKIAGLDRTSLSACAPIRCAYGADSRKAAVGVEVREPEGHAGGFAGDSRVGRLGRRQSDLPIALGKDVSGKPLISESREDAASADRRRDWLGQIGVHQCHISSPSTMRARAMSGC